MNVDVPIMPNPADVRPAAARSEGAHAELWLEAIVNSSDDAIIGETLEGVVTSWNAAAVRIFGYTADEMIGKPISTIMWPGEEGQMDMLLERMRAGERIDHFQSVRRHKDGSKVFVSLSLWPIIHPNGRVIGIAKTARDITDRVALQASLTASTQQVRLLTEREAWAKALILAERRFRDLIENSPDAILQVNTEGTIVIANRTAESVFGYSPAELVGSNIDMLIPELRRSSLSGWQQAFANPGVPRSLGQGLDLYARRQDGTDFPVEISLNPLEVDGNVHVTAAIRDITERKRTEEQVRTLQESYMAELEARQKEAERLNRIKSDFMAGITHELRTPLHTILGFSELLREESEGPLNETQKSFLDHIRRDSEHLLRLINDVLDYSRIEAGGMHLHTESLSVAEAIFSAVSAIQPHADAKGITIEIEEVGELRVLADEMRLRQIFYNLLSNAVKFTPVGGRVMVNAVQEGAFIRFTVGDTGIGISLDEQSRIFERFYQVGHTIGGAGLGLAICRQLVQMQGGTIFVESEPEKGSRFHFTLHKAV